MKYIASIDQGTTSTRCILFDQQGRISAASQKEHKQIYPRPGWVEHDPFEIFENAKFVFQEVVHTAEIKTGEIGAIGITNQRETIVLWNKKTGIPYRNAIVWQDTRTDGVCKTLIDQDYDKIISKKTGLPVATYFSGPKIQWMLQNNKEIRKDIQKDEVLFGNIDAWLIWNMTGGKNGGNHLTDVTNASRTMLFNLETLSWDGELLAMMEIPEAILPGIKSSVDEFGTATEDFFNLPIYGDLGDQQAALFGQACFDPGDVKNTYGTGCFLLLNTGDQIVLSINGLLTTVGYKVEDEPAVYSLEGSVAITGALVQWLRDNIGLIETSSEIELLSQSVDDNGGVYFVPAFSGLYAPHWDSSARGLIIGLTRFAQKGHIARAALEATAFQAFDVLEAMKNDTQLDFHSLKVDGGMVVNDHLMQFQADILDIPIVRPEVAETTALGAAYAAGLKAGFWNSKKEIKHNWKANKRWTPQMTSEFRSKYIAVWKKAVTRSMSWID